MSAKVNEYLKRSALFARLSDREITHLLTGAAERHFAAGERIITQGDLGGVGFFLILEGRAEARAGDTVLAQFGPGDFFGEMALLLDTPRSADVAALEPTSCLVITQWALKGVLAAHPEMALNIMGELARRLADTDRTLRE